MRTKIQLALFLCFALILGFVIALFTSDTNPEEPVSLPQEHITDELSVHFINVGQADCTLILLPTDEVMLIDAGNNDDDILIKNYIDSLDINKIDYLVATHPHEDHIGSVDTIINNYDVDFVFMPDASSESASYKDVILAIETTGTDLIITQEGTLIYSDDTLKIEAVAPCFDYEDLNNQSIVIRLTYKDSSFLFTGDAEEMSERDITRDVSSDVLKVGHHGSSTSTSKNFLERVNPMYAVISCGKDNDYGHPHHETLDILYDNDVRVYRTDKDGTLICRTKGKNKDYKWEIVK